MSQLLRVTAAALILLLAACAGRQPPSTRPGDGFDQSRVAANWRLEGRLALSNGRDGGSGTLTWLQQPGGSQMAFVGAFGRGSWRLTVNPQQAELVLSDGQTSLAPEVGTLVAQATGWEIPVEALTHWVTGAAQPGYPADLNHHPKGYLSALSQHGWRVQFDGRLKAGDITLPRKITATRGPDRVRLLVRQWDLVAAE